MELAPFRAAIAAGVATIMSAHLAVPALGVPDAPATVSARIRTGGVDSWCFLHLAFPRPLDASPYDAVEVTGCDSPAAATQGGAR